MPPRALACSFNIQKNLKTLKNKGDAPVELLAKALRSPGPIGKSLRMLVRRVRHPEKPYSHEDLIMLLLLSLALRRNEEQK